MVDCQTLSNIVEHIGTVSREGEGRNQVSNIVEHRRAFPNTSLGGGGRVNVKCRILSNIVEHIRGVSNLVEKKGTFGPKLSLGA